MPRRTLKSSLDACHSIKALLIKYGIDSALSGGIYIATRPVGSTQEDCVINTTYADADQVQTVLINVNFHVENLKSQPSDNPTATDNTQPNRERLNQLGELAAAVLDSQESTDYSLRLRNPGKIEGYQNDWYYNIVVEYTHLRKDLE